MVIARLGGMFSDLGGDRAILSRQIEKYMRMWLDRAEQDGVLGEMIRAQLLHASEHLGWRRVELVLSVVLLCRFFLHCFFCWKYCWYRPHDLSR